MYIQNYANVLVQNRITGKLKEERCQFISIKLGISCCMRPCNQSYGRWSRQCCAVSDQSYEFQLWLQLKFGIVMNCYPSANCPTPAACNAHDLVGSISQWQLAPQQD